MMSNAVHNLHHAEHIVYGWIREMEKELQLNDIPVEITRICVDYYKEDEIFEIMGKNMEFSKDGKIVTRKYVTGGWLSLFILEFWIFI